jgi:hypothetical protein
MKRFAIFCLLGPPVGSSVILGPVGAMLAIALVYGLPFIYLFGFAPALVTSVADDYLARRLEFWPSVAASTVVGATISVIWLSAIFGLNTSVGFNTITSAPSKLGLALQFAAVGAVPAGLCSWLTGASRSSD